MKHFNYKRIIGVTAIGVAAFAALVLPEHLPAITDAPIPVPGIFQADTIEAGTRSDREKRKKRRKKNKRNRERQRESRNERNYCEKHGDHAHARSRCGDPFYVAWCQVVYLTSAGYRL